MEPHAILFISDDESLAEHAYDLFDDAGFRVADAADPDAAIEICGIEMPALLVIDGRLPEGGAFDFCRRFRELDGSGSQPVLWLAEPEDEAAAFGIGASAFLTPPLDDDELVSMAKAFLASDEGRASLESALVHLREQDYEDALSGFHGVAR
jgi:DNA-binding response OmpR family regulator